MSQPPGEFHQLIASEVRDLVRTYRIQRQGGEVSEAVVGQLASRATHLVLSTLAQFTTAAERGKLLPALVRALLATFLEELVAEERRAAETR
jgi:hypothetical protein